MGWEDRPYYRDRASSPTNPLMWLLMGSVPLGTWFGIRVRMHASMIIVIAFTLLFAETRGGLGAKNAITSMTILFLSVLLHEFGHCFGARIMGGEAREILMWPLGGLAFTEPPHRPWPSFVTTAAGPLVNVSICVITGVAIAVLNRSPAAIPWFPLREGLRSYVPHDWTTYYIWWVFLVNYALLAFNLLLVFYPFDGGRMVQELLWFKFGYYKSMRFATVVGMIGASFVAAFGLATWSLMLVLIAVFGFMTCYRQRQALQEVGPEDWQDSPDYSASVFGGGGSSTRTRRQSRFSRWSAARAKKRAREEASEQEKIDHILAKVSAHGMHSLTWLEKRALHKATERQRKRDLETGRARRG
jgi:stage IV sporulation protein FB